MAHGGSRGGGQTGYRRWSEPQSLVLLGRRLGAALLGAAVPALVATVGAAFLSGDVAPRPLEWVESAMTTAVVGGHGLQWAFHVAVLCVLAGLVAFGVAFVLEGYLGLD